MMSQSEVVMIDMPELLLRMKIVNEHSLAEIQQIFNYVLNKISRSDGPCGTPDAAALYYFPEVFAKPRDEYVAAMLHDIATDTNEDGQGFSSISAYLGNLHIKPISRVWNTYKLDRDFTHVKQKATPSNMKHPKDVLKPQEKLTRPFTLDYTKISQMEYNIEEPAEEKIAKHAILEALFGTQLWMESYVKNPFIYITDNDSDF